MHLMHPMVATFSDFDNSVVTLPIIGANEAGVLFVLHQNRLVSVHATGMTLRQVEVVLDTPEAPKVKKPTSKADLLKAEAGKGDLQKEEVK